MFQFELHHLMNVLAAVGAFLSFFHQGSLGGLYGVLQGRPFAYRESLAAWPSTFFLFILTAAAVGPSFVLATTWIVSKVSGRVLVKPSVFVLLARVSGSLLLVYVLAKSVDTLVWINHTSFRFGVHPASFYAFAPFGTWALFAEIVLLGLVPALLLVSSRTRKDPRLLVPAAFLACAGVAMNRFVMTVQTLALPTLAFDPFLSYTPSWQEVASFLAVVAYGVEGQREEDDGAQDAGVIGHGSASGASTAPEAIWQIRVS